MHSPTPSPGGRRERWSSKLCERSTFSRNDPLGSRIYETALRFEAQELGWSYGDNPTFVLTTRDLPRIRDTVEFHSGDLAQFVNWHLRPAFRTSWLVGGGVVPAECLRRRLAGKVRYSILPILIGDGIQRMALPPLMLNVRWPTIIRDGMRTHYRRTASRIANAPHALL